jgi:hypothetical protein
MSFILWGDVKERGEVQQGKMLNDAGTTLQQQLIALAGCGTVEVDVAGSTVWQIPAYFRN